MEEAPEEARMKLAWVRAGSMKPAVGAFRF
jgi:hypothetical protein